MPTVEVSFSPLPAHVRTARLIAVAVARRAGVPDELLDEVRLAVGEACSRAVELHARHLPDEPVRMLLTDSQDRFTVEVVDQGPENGGSEDGAPDFVDLRSQGAALTETAAEPQPALLPAGFGLAVISGLVDDLDVERDANGTRVRMTWPAVDIMAPPS